MIKITLDSYKDISIEQDEKVYVGENNISKIDLFFPDKINAYSISECRIEMRSYLSEDKYISQVFDNPSSSDSVPVTLDYTDEVRVIKIMLIITNHDGNVIGKTNKVRLKISPTGEGGTHIDPREELDEIIAELRAEIAEQAETISTQGETITQQTEQITELNGEVSTLEGTVTEQQATITRQNTTIDELNERRTPVYIQPSLESKEIVPKVDTRYYAPSEGKDGFSSVTVDGATVEALGLNENYYKRGEPFLDKVGTYNPFPENSYGGIYFTKLNEDDFPVGIKVVNYDYNYNNFSIPGLNMNTLRSNIKSFILLDCKNVKIGKDLFNGASLLTICQLDGVLDIGTAAFQNCTSLTEVNLPNSLTSIDWNAFQNCTSLTEVNLPNSLTSIGNFAFLYCSSLTEVNFPNSLTSIGSNAFQNCSSLTNLTLAQGFNCNGLNVSWSTRFTAETIVACLEALADRTRQTAYTITFGTKNLNKLTNEQKAIAINKNWNLA